MTNIVKVHPDSVFPNPVSIQIYSDSPENYFSIKENISKVGILEPLIVNHNTMVVISGNIRLKIAKELCMNEIPVIFITESDLCPEILTVCHGQQRIKKYSEILRERLIWEKAFPVPQGARTDLKPELKKNKEALDQIDFGISGTKIQSLKAIDKPAKKLYGEGSPEYAAIWKELDAGKVGLRRKYKNLVFEDNLRANNQVLPSQVDISDNVVHIFNKSCENMREITDASIACIHYFSPIFQNA